MNLSEFAFVDEEVKPIIFLELLSSIARRVESGNNNSVTLKECEDWGIAPSDAIHGLFLLVKTGILHQTVAVYKEEEDVFDNVHQPAELEGVCADDVRFWFKPVLNAEQFQPFFV